VGAASALRGTSHVAALTVVVVMGAVMLLDAPAFGASPFDVFLRSDWTRRPAGRSVPELEEDHG